MAMPKPKQPIYASGYYRPRRFRPVHFLPPMKVKLNDQPSASPRTRRKDGPYNRAATTTSKDTAGRRGRYKNMVLTLACNLTIENVSDMKFLCKEHVNPPELLDKIRYPRDLIALLENQRLLAENSLYFIQTLLYYISRLDLYELVLDFRVDNQQEYKNKGVDIKSVYDLRNDSSERVALAQELSQFRRDLKPRSRLQMADVPELRNRLYDLTTKMHDRVSEVRQTTAAKFKLLHDSEQLPHPIAKAEPVSVGADGKSESISAENDDVVVKLKLYNRQKMKEICKAEPKVRRKRTRIPSERLSIASNASMTMISPSGEVTKSSSESVPVKIVVPTISYEQDERLRLTPYVNKTKTEPKAEEVFRYTTPIPPPRSETMSKMSKLTPDVTLDKSSDKKEQGKEDVKKESKIPIPEQLPSNVSPLRKSTTSADSGQESTGAEFDTQHLSTAIQKLRKKMGIQMAGPSSRDSFHAFQRTAPPKTKPTRKDGHNVGIPNKALIPKSKKRRLADKTAKLPDIYDKFARRKSTSQVQYMNLLK